MLLMLLLIVLICYMLASFTVNTKLTYENSLTIIFYTSGSQPFPACVPPSRKNKTRKPPSELLEDIITISLKILA